MEKEPGKKQNIMDTPLPLILEGIETAAADARKAAVKQGYPEKKLPKML